ncbi:MAG: glutathionylspermidine synthase family protein [Xanthomonadales bacterium]|nr:glutathionylspermidine synthase family protein [Xanthomonadales bacterium]
MRRQARVERPDWRRHCEELGFDFHTIDGARYWDESAAYAFSLAQIEIVEAAAETLNQLCLELVDDLVGRQDFSAFRLSAAAAELITRSWRRGDRSLYGRFDLSWDGSARPPKLLEFNADTPTGLLEASVVQWFWLQDCRCGEDQFNSLHEQLIARWQQCLIPGTQVHFAALAGHPEDSGTTRYLMDTALQAGLRAVLIDIESIGHADDGRGFVDLNGQAITHLFKLYPWEWLWQDDFAEYLADAQTVYFEPPWKLLLSSKALLPLLWQRYPDHPNLLAASFADDLGRPAVRKPIYSREGANVCLLSAQGDAIETAGPYGEEGWIYQAPAPLPCLDGHYPVIGAWIVGEQAAGIGIREDRSPITQNSSRFVPHYFNHSDSP